MLVGIRQYVDAAIKTYGAREERQQQEKREAREERLKNQYEHYRDHEIKRIKSTMSPDELAEMESTIRADLKAEGIKQFAHGLETSRRMDKKLAARASVLPYEEWRKQQA